MEFNTSSLINISTTWIGNTTTQHTIITELDKAMNFTSLITGAERGSSTTSGAYDVTTASDHVTTADHVTLADFERFFLTVEGQVVLVALFFLALLLVVGFTLHFLIIIILFSSIDS